MIDLDITPNEFQAYERALHSDHRIRLDVQILDSNEDHVNNATFPKNHVLGGSVNVDVQAEGATRQLELTLLDPGRRLPFVPSNAAQGGLFAENLIQVRYCVEVLELDKWVEVPVFRGPLTLYEHDGDTLRIEALGKETLAQSPQILIQGFTLKKGLELDVAMKRVLMKNGERLFDIPPLAGEKLAKDLPVRPGQEAWKIVTGGADDTSTTGGKVDGIVQMTKNEYYAFYNGRGRFTLRRVRRPHVFKFTEDWLVEKPTMTYDILNFRNYVKVTGAKGDGKKKQVYAEVSLHKGHPLSPESLRRNGEPRYMAVLVDAPNLKTEKECKEKAKDILDDREKAGLEASFECVPVPHLEEFDPIRVETSDGSFDIILRQFTIPLTAAETMSIGFNKHVRQYAHGSGEKRERRKQRQRRRRRRRHRRRQRREDKKHDGNKK